MKVLVAVKRVVDYNVKVRVNAAGTDVDIASAKMSMNPSASKKLAWRPKSSWSAQA
jgi:electron transfer flavoprotein alpha/beta subunit